MLFVGMDEAQKAELITQLSPLWTTPSASFLLGGLERVFAIFFHICASYLVYRAISASKPLFLVIAVLLHAVMDGLTVVLASLAGTAAAEIFLAVFTVIFVTVTVIMYRKEKEPLVEAAPQ